MRLLLILLVGYLLYHLFLRLLPLLMHLSLKGMIKRGEKMFQGGGTGRAKSQPDAEEMVSCSGCGTFVMKSSAGQKNGRFFCSEKCRGKE